MIKKEVRIFFETLLIILFIVSSSFLINDNNLVSAEEINEKYGNDLYQGTYERNYNELYSYDEGEQCCLETNSGKICQNVPQDYSECASQLQYTKCNEVASCKLGCCYDNLEGLCDPNTPQDKCNQNEGEWFNDASCNINSCQKGCCVLGDDIDYVTEKRCEYLTSLNGLNGINYDQNLPRSECLGTEEIIEMGACINDLRMCDFINKLECNSNTGKEENFYLDYLCSNENFDNECKKQAYTGCIEGKDEIYWFDSCGNRENIYSSDKAKSWNNGLVLPKEEACGSGESNIDSSSCGNCNYLLGSKCRETSLGEKSIDDGNFICADMTCIDSSGDIRQNGESWCVYDSFIGDGMDPVGSRHWRRICIDGEIKVEACQDSRQEICVEEEIETEEGLRMDLATCRPNRWKSCIGINDIKEKTEEEKRGLCEEDVDCFWKETQIGDSEINLCVPNYPSGFMFWMKNESEEEVVLPDEEICNFADQICTVVFVCGSCKVNCQCLKQEFTEGMNDLCVSLGDCGGQINYEGVYSGGGYTIKNAPKIDQTLKEELFEIVLDKVALQGEAENYLFSGGLERKKNVGGDAHGGIKSWQHWLDWGSWFGSPWFGECKVKKVKVNFDCNLWQPPVENQKCDSCNKNPFKPCTEYRCHSLGAACDILNFTELTENPVCYEINAMDKDEPVLVVKNYADGLSVEQKDKTFEVRTSEGECVQAFKPIQIELESDDSAQCRVEYLEDTEFENMSQDFFETSRYTNEHNFVTLLPSLESLPKESIEGTDLENQIGNFKAYIKCQDTQGNVNEESYILDICLSRGEDRIAPEIVATIPASESYLKYKQEILDLKIYIIEPAECKYSKLSDVNYENMEGSFVCNNELEKLTDLGWECSTSISDLTAMENKIYIKCKDQPWLDSEDSKRNVNIENFVYTLYSSNSELNIDFINVDNITSGFEPIAVTLEAETSGGVNKGESLCSYSFTSNEDNLIEFRETLSNKHKQLFTSMMGGEYKIYVTCEDNAGNKATGEISFNVDVDTTAPRVVRVFNSGGNLEIITNEKAVCYYDFERCNFNTEDSTLMSTGFELNHKADWEVGKTYHIKCEDEWGNKNPECAIKIMPNIFN